MYVVAIVNQILELNKSIAAFDEQIAEAIAKHSDEKIFRSLPGAGDALVPRMIAGMGSDRDRYDNAAEVQSHTGIAPVTRSSGKFRSVKKRSACNKFIRQNLPRICLSLAPLERLGRSLLPHAKIQREEAQRSSAGVSLQVDSHHFLLVEERKNLRRTTLFESTQSQKQPDY